MWKLQFNRNKPLKLKFEILKAYWLVSNSEPLHISFLISLVNSKIKLPVLSRSSSALVTEILASLRAGNSLLIVRVRLLAPVCLFRNPLESLETFRTPAEFGDGITAKLCCEAKISDSSSK